MRCFVVWSLLLALGCNSPEPSGAAKVEPPAVAAPAATTIAQSAPSAAPSAAPSDLKWPSSIAWQSWEAGLPQSQQSGKPIVLVVYADWCARCKELAPAFADPRVQALAQRAVMVRQNQDTAPAWLTEQFGAHGTYVPRVFFVEPGGVVRTDLVSGHPRYPYFYAPIALEPLIANLSQITGG